MKICGIDPGLEATGYGLIETTGGQLALVTAGVVRSPTAVPLEARLAAISDGIQALLAAQQPDCLVLEALYSHYDHPMTAILMGHARGVVLLAAAGLGLPVEGYPATHVKKAVTGRGHATKEQMGRMVQVLLNLPQPPSPEDAADALAIAITHAHTLRAPIANRESPIIGAVR